MLILFFILWIILNGRINAEILLFGAGVSALIGFFMHKLTGWDLAAEKKILRFVPLIALYIPVLIREIIKAALAVMKLALNPRKKPDPVIVGFHSGYQTDFQNVLLANSITLTPGTLTLFQEGDYFVIHCLRREFAEGLSTEVSPFDALLSKMV